MSDEFAEDDILGRFPPLEMTDLRKWLLSPAEHARAMRDLVQGSFPERWFAAERKLRSDREALRILADVEGAEHGRADADLPTEHDISLQLLEEALPHLPEGLADQVRHLLETK